MLIGSWEIYVGHVFLMGLYCGGTFGEGEFWNILVMVGFMCFSHFGGIQYGQCFRVCLWVSYM